MEIKVGNIFQLKWVGDVLVIGLFEDVIELIEEMVELDEMLFGILFELIKEIEFKGKVNSSVLICVGIKIFIWKIIVVGLGKLEKLKLDFLC